MALCKRTLVRSLKISLFIWWFPYILLNIVLILMTYGDFDPFFGELLKDAWDNFIFGLIPIAIIYFIVYKVIKIGVLDKDPFNLKISLFVTFMEFMFKCMYTLLYNISEEGTMDFISPFFVVFEFIGTSTIPIFLINFLFIWLYRLFSGKIRNRNANYIQFESKRNRGNNYIQQVYKRITKEKPKAFVLAFWLSWVLWFLSLFVLISFME